MNKFSLVVLIAFFSFSPQVFAQDASADNDAAKNAQQLLAARQRSMAAPMGMPAITKDKIEKVMQSVLELGLVYKMLEQPTMVALDNGIVVAYGNTLRKYDKDLNVIKEVDLDVDVNGMQDLASKFAKKYTDEMMDLVVSQQATGDASAQTGSSAAAAPAVSSTDSSYNDQKEAAIKKEIDQMK